MKHLPPKWPNKFLQWYCRPERLEEIQGDVFELFERDLKAGKKRLATFKFAWNVLRFFRWSNIRRSKNKVSTSSPFFMFSNYLTVFLRNFFRQKAYSFLNAFGLAIGIACFMLISFYIADEYSYDRFHTKHERIFRVHEIFETDGVGERSASLPFPTAEALKNDFAGQVVSAVRFFNFQAPAIAVSSIDDKKEFNEKHLFFTDSSVFDVFDFEFVKGDRKTALDDTHSIVITESMARKYFGDDDPMGKYLKIQGKSNLIVTGILKDIPRNAHLRFDFLVSFATLSDYYNNGKIPDGWYWNPCWTYLLLKDQRDAKPLEASLPKFVMKYFPEFVRKDIVLELFPLGDIHLKSHMDYEISPNSSMTTIYVFSSIAVFVLLIACINFINLSTARAAKRAKEVGMRKTLGSQKLQLVFQFLFESVALCIIAVTLAIIIVVACLPSFNTLADKEISLSILLRKEFLIILVLVPLVAGSMAGIYPAFILSSFKPITALRGAAKHDSGELFRKALVVVQFSLSIILMICTGVAIDQLNMLQTADVGFQQENVIMIPVSRTAISKNYESIKAELLQNHNVQSVTALEEVLGSKHQVANYLMEGQTESRPYPHLNIRHDFAKTFGIPIVAGRDYSEDVFTDDSLALLVNEEFVRQMGWTSNEAAIGKTFDNRANRKVIGVLKDFNFTSRHQPIRPLVLDLNMNPGAFNLFLKYMAVRVKPENMSSTIEYLEQTWKSHMPGWPFEYFFLNQELEQLYIAEKKQSKIAGIFAGLSILVGCLGLFGLSTYTAEQRKKEMSIRKVLGSSNREVLLLFSKNFLTLVLLANVFAFPIAYVLLKQWLSGFAYHVPININLFFISAIIAIVISIATILYQGIRSANINPAHVLKND
jgi:putative ABC transport system permease protein